jgi:hypothetical protein
MNFSLRFGMSRSMASEIWCESSRLRPSAISVSSLSSGDLDAGGNLLEQRIKRALFRSAP